MKLSTRKSLTLLLCACLLVASLFSAATLALHGGHHCDDEGCDICACLELSGATLRLTAVLLAWGLLFGPNPRGWAALRALFGAPARLATPVSLRVRMNH